MSKLPLFWGAASDQDFAAGIHRHDGNDQPDPVPLCAACGVSPAQRTGLITARPLCLDCAHVEEELSVEQFAARWRRGVAVGERLLARRTG